MRKEDIQTCLEEKICRWKRIPNFIVSMTNDFINNDVIECPQELVSETENKIWLTFLFSIYANFNLDEQRTLIFNPISFKSDEKSQSAIHNTQISSQLDLNSYYTLLKQINDMNEDNDAIAIMENATSIYEKLGKKKLLQISEIFKQKSKESYNHRIIDNTINLIKKVGIKNLEKLIEINNEAEVINISDYIFEFQKKHKRKLTNKFINILSLYPDKLLIENSGEFNSDEIGELESFIRKAKEENIYLGSAELFFTSFRVAKIFGIESVKYVANNRKYFSEISDEDLKVLQQFYEDKYFEVHNQIKKFANDCTKYYNDKEKKEVVFQRIHSQLISQIKQKVQGLESIIEGPINLNLSMLNNGIVISSDLARRLSQNNYLTNGGCSRDINNAIRDVMQQIEGLEDWDAEEVIHYANRTGAINYVSPYAALIKEGNLKLIRTSTAYINQIEESESQGSVYRYLHLLDPRFYGFVENVGAVISVCEEAEHKRDFIKTCNKKLDDLIEISGDITLRSLVFAQKIEKAMSEMGQVYFESAADLYEDWGDLGFRTASLSLITAAKTSTEFANYYFFQIKGISKTLIEHLGKREGNLVLEKIHKTIPKNWRFVGASIGVLPELIKEKGTKETIKLYEDVAAGNDRSGTILEMGAQHIWFDSPRPYTSVHAMESQFYCYNL